MHDSSHPERLTHSPRVRLLAVTALATAVLVAGCGGSSSSPSVASASSTTTSTSSAASTGAATSSRTSSTTTSRLRTAPGGGAASGGTPAPGDLQSQELAYSRCMRADGVPNFPDPKPGGGFLIERGAGPDPTSPSVKAAQAKCQNLLPDGGAGPTLSVQAGVQLLNVATCMRQHGISAFPDPEKAPTSSLPAPKPGVSRITDYQGWLLEFPATINMQSPAYTRAAAACGAQFLNTPQR